MCIQSLAIVERGVRSLNCRSLWEIKMTENDSQDTDLVDQEKKNWKDILTLVKVDYYFLYLDF